MSKTTNFIKLVVAIITGDDAQATALKIQRKASAILTAQIAVKVARTLELEEVVENATEAVGLALINNGELITYGENYVSTLNKAQNTLNAAQDSLEAHLETITFLEEKLALVQA